ncbi:MAG: phosphoribosylanthranilate isomerase [Oscillospiraceae bacterium]
MIKIKICGIKRPEDAEYVNELRPDYIGFIFAEERKKRYIPPEKAEILRNMIDSDIKSVGVFVDSTYENICSIAERGIIDVIQLHGNESDEYISEIKKRTGLPVIKAFKISSAEDIKNAVKSCADYILLDNGVGGTGQSFDWKLIKNIDRPFFIAGGLDSGNVSEAVKKYSPYGVDTSSGVETDGIKDYNKICDFINQVRFLQK